MSGRQVSSKALNALGSPPAGARGLLPGTVAGIAVGSALAAAACTAAALILVRRRRGRGNMREQQTAAELASGQASSGGATASGMLALPWATWRRLVGGRATVNTSHPPSGFPQKADTGSGLGTPYPPLSLLEGATVSPSTASPAPPPSQTGASEGLGARSLRVLPGARTVGPAASSDKVGQGPGWVQQVLSTSHASLGSGGSLHLSHVSSEAASSAPVAWHRVRFALSRIELHTA